eukprot:g6202.t1
MEKVAMGGGRDEIPEGARDLSTPLLLDMGENQDDTDSSTIGSPEKHRAVVRGEHWPSGGRDGARGSGSGVVGRVAVPPTFRWTNASANALPRVPTRAHVPRGDYRSEGEQPSTERNGSRRPPVDAPRQDSFRTNRMPKRGGRKRLRRNMGRAAAARRRRVKIRVSSYCVARSLKTLELLQWLERQPNRQLSQSYLAEGAAAAPRGPVEATVSSTKKKTDGQDLKGAAAGGDDDDDADDVVGGVDVAIDVESADATRGTTAAAPSPFAEGLEWMDSLYIDVIHSTTDIKGGLRKARDLERPAWEEDVYVDGEDGDGYGDGYGYGYRYGYGSDGGGDEEGGDSVGGGSAGIQWETAAEGEMDRDQEREHEHERGTEDDGADFVTRHKDVVFFPYGAVVFWGCSEAEEKEVLSNLNDFMVGKVSDTELAQSFDDMTFVYRHRGGKRGVPLKNDEITLDTRDPAEKLAYSCALAQSAKLFVFEERLDNIIEITSKYPQVLAATGYIPLTEIQIGRLVGRVLCEQNEVNLHSDILDTPEYFWEEDAWEPAYEALCAYLDIPLRVDNLNKRLSILRELLDVLSTQSTNAHATRLEVIIIYLIFVEVAIELVWNVIIKDVFGLVGPRSGQ